MSRLTGKAYSNLTLMPNVCTTSPPNSISAHVCNYYDAGGATAYANGRLTSVTDPSGSETFSYDSNGRVTQKVKVIGSTSYPIQYGYNPGGQLTQITYPSGRIVQQNVDKVGLLNTVVSGTTTYASIPEPPTGYNAAQQLLSFTYGNGVGASFVYSPTRQQMTSLSYVSGSTTLFSLNYYYQNDPTNCKSGSSGNDDLIQCIVDNTPNNPYTQGAAGRTAGFTYDALGRLSTAQTTGSQQFAQWGMSWTYDQYGNRTNQAVTAGTAPSNSLSFATTPAPPANPPGGAYTNRPDGFSFDASGNMLGDGQNTLSYDAANCLTSSANSMAGTSTYTCDSQGVRVVKALQNGTTTAYVFAGGRDIAEYDNGAAVNSPSREYIYLGSTLISTIQGTTALYHHSDHLSVRVTTNTSGTNIGEQGHYPYGEQWYAPGTTTKFFFTSYERDSTDSGNDYAMARFYINRFGRFSCVDPLIGQPGDPQSWNRYAFVRNNPTNNVDPSGTSFIHWLFSVFRLLANIFLGGTSSGSALGLGTPPIFSDPMGNTQATLNSIYNPTDPSRFGIENFVKTECTFNVFIGSNFLVNNGAEKAMLREMRRIFGDAKVGIKRVSSEQGADFAVGVSTELDLAYLNSLVKLPEESTGGATTAEGNIVYTSAGTLLSLGPHLSSAQLGAALGDVASHEIGHKIWPGQGHLSPGGLNDYDIMGEGSGKNLWKGILLFRADAAKADVLNACKGMHGGE